MAKVILLCGKVASGKTTYAKSLIKKINAVHLSVDEITHVLFGTHGGENHGEVAARTLDFLLSKSVEIINSGINVVLEWGFIKREKRREVSEFYRNHGIIFEWHYINTPDDVLFNNLNKRNQEIEEGKSSAHYFDLNFAKQLWDMFEEPGKEENNILKTINLPEY